MSLIESYLSYRCRLNSLTKTLNDPTLILNFKIFCRANK